MNILAIVNNVACCLYMYRVPLLPRQPPPEPTEDKGGKKKAGGGGGGVQSPQPPVEDLTELELDQQLVVHAYNSAMAVVFHLAMAEMKVLETAIRELSKPPSAQPQTELDKPPEAGREEKTSKGKKGKVSCNKVSFYQLDLYGHSGTKCVCMCCNLS